MSTSNLPPSGADERALRLFVVELGAAMNEAGDPVYQVQERLTRVARAHGAEDARVSVFPTYLIVSMGPGSAVTMELTSVMRSPRLDQMAALDRLLQQAEAATIGPLEGLARLEEIRRMGPRFRDTARIAGYSALALGVCLTLKPAPREAAAAIVLGAAVGVLRSRKRAQQELQVLLPFLAALLVAIMAALGHRHGLHEAGIRAMVAALIVFLPGAALTTAVLELAAGQVVSGSSRLVAGVMQLALLTFGILAGVEVVGVQTAELFSEPDHALGAWAPWIGVLVFALGVVVSNSAPRRALPGLLVVLYSALAGQLAGNALFGPYVSAFVGALVMTPVAFWIHRLPSAMPPRASFLPGFWLLVPGALGLIGLAQVAGDADIDGAQHLAATVVSIFAVAVGVLTGTLVLAGASATGRRVSEWSGTLADHRRWLLERRRGTSR